MVLPAGWPAPPPVVLAFPEPSPSPAAALPLPPLGGTPPLSLEGGGSLPCRQRSRSRYISSVALEAAEEFLSLDSLLLGLASADPHPPALPVAIKSKPVEDPPAPPAPRGRSQAARVGHTARPKSATASPAAPNGHKRTA
jgi:hypothetical protein